MSRSLLALAVDAILWGFWQALLRKNRLLLCAFYFQIRFFYSSYQYKRSKATELLINNVIRILYNHLENLQLHDSVMSELTRPKTAYNHEESRKIVCGPHGKKLSGKDIRKLTNGQVNIIKQFLVRLAPQST